MNTFIIKNKLFVIGVLCYLFLLLLAGIYYKERIIFTDTSFYLYSIIKNKSFCIQHNRFGAICTQLLPFIAIKLGLSLKIVAIIYSESIIIFYFLVFLIIIKYFKNQKLALVWLGFNTLIVSHSFYWMLSELPQAVALFFIYFTLLNNVLLEEKTPIYFYPIALLLLVTVCFTHPLVLFVEIFTLIFFILHQPLKKKIISWNLATILVILLIKSFYFKTEYDTNAMSGIVNIYKLFPNYFNLQSNKNFIQYLIHDFYFIFFLFLLVFIFQIRYKQYKKLLFTILFSFGYLLLVNISYRDGTNQFYIETQYLLLTVFGLIPFSFDVFPKIKSVHKYTAVGFILFFCIIRIAHSHEIFTQRIQWERNLLSKTETLPNKKLIIVAEKKINNTLFMTWASSYEFWLLSTIEQNNSKSVIIVDNNNELTWQKGYNKSFITKWEITPYNKLDKKYFIFNDTSYYCDYEYKE